MSDDDMPHSHIVWDDDGYYEVIEDCDEWFSARSNSGGGGGGRGNMPEYRLGKAGLELVDDPTADIDAACAIYADENAQKELRKELHGYRKGYERVKQELHYSRQLASETAAALKVSQNGWKQQMTAHCVTLENSRRKAQWVEQKCEMLQTTRCVEEDEYKKMKAALEKETAAHNVTRENNQHYRKYVEDMLELSRTCSSMGREKSQQRQQDYKQMKAALEKAEAALEKERAAHQRTQKMYNGYRKMNEELLSARSKHRREKKQK
jgi:hypothetical protein